MLASNIRRFAMAIAASIIWGAADGTIVHVRDRALQCYQAVQFVYQLEHRLKDLEKDGAIECQRRSTSRCDSEDTSTVCKPRHSTPAARFHWTIFIRR
jgi:hypothetical protein